jgi:predicted HAD superfamily Cof-like phosphohydrolase/archaellum component FlaC
MSTNWVTDIYDMNEKFGHHGIDFDGNFLEFRINFLKEEFREFLEAIDSNDAEKTVDALVDFMVVAIGTMDHAGVDIHQAWNEVHQRNMEKESGPNSTRSGSGGIDLIKPLGWIPPNHKGNTGYFDLAIQQLLKKREVLKELEEPGKENGVPSHIKTLQSYIDHALDKTHDYDDDTDPDFFHFKYYPEGISNIVYEIEKKVKRIKHGLKKLFKDGSLPKTDSLHDSFRDISIYSGIGDTILSQKLEGQTEDRDIFNREIPR